MTAIRWQAIGLLISAGLLIGCGQEEAYQKPPVPVRVQAVETYGGGGGVRYSANIMPNEQVVLSFRIGGYIHEILQVQGSDGRMRAIQEGDTVVAGTVLARVRQDDYLAKVNQARSQLNAALAAAAAAKSQHAEAQAGWENAKLTYDRAGTLYASQSLTKPEYDGAKAQLDMIQAKRDAARAGIEATEAQVAGARALVDEAELALRDSALTAPINGVVLKRQIEVGMLVGPGTPAIMLADTRSVKALFGVPDITVRSFKLGEQLSVTTEAVANTEFTGKITRISPSADFRSRLFDVEITLANPQNLLRTGMIAALQVAAEKLAEPVVVVPLSALVQSKTDPSGFAVYVVEGQGNKQVARVRNVKIGDAYGNAIAITEGVRAGERVIVTGATVVVDGQEVRATS